ncbi:uncharacterized protein [Lepisosteus oculatus]|uniref:uncharacterized protein n=1 Tax=Lepisosteus oculatus TaxID=7918 RepID=UPI00371E332D
MQASDVWVPQRPQPALFQAPRGSPSASALSHHALAAPAGAGSAGPASAPGSPQDAALAVLQQFVTERMYAEGSAPGAHGPQAPYKIVHQNPAAPSRRQPDQFGAPAQSARPHRAVHFANGQFHNTAFAPNRVVFSRNPVAPGGNHEPSKSSGLVAQQEHGWNRVSSSTGRPNYGRHPSLALPFQLHNQGAPGGHGRCGQQQYHMLQQPGPRTEAFSRAGAQGLAGASSSDAQAWTPSLSAPQGQPRQWSYYSYPFSSLGDSSAAGIALQAGQQRYPASQACLQGKASDRPQNIPNRPAENSDTVSPLGDVRNSGFPSNQPFGAVNPTVNVSQNAREAAESITVNGRFLPALTSSQFGRAPCHAGQQTPTRPGFLGGDGGMGALEAAASRGDSTVSGASGSLDSGRGHGALSENIRHDAGKPPETNSNSTWPSSGLNREAQPQLPHFPQVKTGTNTPTFTPSASVSNTPTCNSLPPAGLPPPPYPRGLEQSYLVTVKKDTRGEGFTAHNVILIDKPSSAGGTRQLPGRRRGSSGRGSSSDSLLRGRGPEAPGPMSAAHVSDQPAALPLPPAVQQRGLSQGAGRSSVFQQHRHTQENSFLRDHTVSGQLVGSSMASTALPTGPVPQKMRASDVKLRNELRKGVAEVLCAFLSKCKTSQTDMSPTNMPAQTQTANLSPSQNESPKDVGTPARGEYATPGKEEYSHSLIGKLLCSSLSRASEPQIAIVPPITQKYVASPEKLRAFLNADHDLPFKILNVWSQLEDHASCSELPIKEDFVSSLASAHSDGKVAQEISSKSPPAKGVEAPATAEVAQTSAESPSLRAPPGSWRDQPFKITPAHCTESQASPGGHSMGSLVGLSSGPHSCEKQQSGKNEDSLGPDSNLSTCTLASVPVKEWTLERIQQLVNLFHDCVARDPGCYGVEEVANQRWAVRNDEPLDPRESDHEIESIVNFWSSGITLDQQSVIFSEVKPDCFEKIAPHCITVGPSAVPCVVEEYKSTWLNLNEKLDDIDKECGFPLCLLLKYQMTETESSTSHVQEMQNLEAASLTTCEQTEDLAPPAETESANIEDALCNTQVTVVQPGNEIFSVILNESGKEELKGSPPVETPVQREVIPENYCCLLRLLEDYTGSPLSPSCNCQFRSKSEKEHLTGRTPSTGNGGGLVKVCAESSPEQLPGAGDLPRVTEPQLQTPVASRDLAQVTEVQKGEMDLGAEHTTIAAVKHKELNGKILRSRFKSSQKAAPERQGESEVPHKRQRGEDLTSGKGRRRDCVVKLLQLPAPLKRSQSHKGENLDRVGGGESGQGRKGEVDREILIPSVAKKSPPSRRRTEGQNAQVVVSVASGTSSAGGPGNKHDKGHKSEGRKREREDGFDCPPSRLAKLHLAVHSSADAKQTPKEEKEPLSKKKSSSETGPARSEKRGERTVSLVLFGSGSNSSLEVRSSDGNLALRRKINPPPVIEFTIRSKKDCAEKAALPKEHVLLNKNRLSEVGLEAKEEKKSQTKCSGRPQQSKTKQSLGNKGPDNHMTTEHPSEYSQGSLHRRVVDFKGTDRYYKPMDQHRRKKGSQLKTENPKSCSKSVLSLNEQSDSDIKTCGDVKKSVLRRRASQHEQKQIAFRKLQHKERTKSQGTVAPICLVRKRKRPSIMQEAFTKRVSASGSPTTAEKDKLLQFKLWPDTGDLFGFKDEGSLKKESRQHPNSVKRAGSLRETGMQAGSSKPKQWKIKGYWSQSSEGRSPEKEPTSPGAASPLLTPSSKTTADATFQEYKKRFLEKELKVDKK